MEKPPSLRQHIRHISPETQGILSKLGIRLSRLTTCPSNTSHSDGNTTIVMPASPIGVEQAESRPPAEITVHLNSTHAAMAALPAKERWGLPKLLAEGESAVSGSRIFGEMSPLSICPFSSSSKGPEG